MRGGGVRLYIIKKANKLNKYTGGGGPTHTRDNV